MHSKIKTLNARNRGPNYELNRVKKYYNEFRGALKIHFRKKLGIWPNKGGGGLTEAQVFVEIFQKQICLGKWPEM